MHLSPPPPPVALTAVRSKAVVLLLLIYCLMYFLLFVGVLWLSLFCYALLCVHSSFAIILKRKRKLDASLLLFYRCFANLNVMWLFLTVPWVGLQCVSVVFLDNIHLVFLYIYPCTPYRSIIRSLSTLENMSIRNRQNSAEPWG